MMVSGYGIQDWCIDLREQFPDNYVLSIAALVASLAPYTQLLRPLVEYVVRCLIYSSGPHLYCFRGYLVSGTPPSSISSQTILAVLSQHEDFDHSSTQQPNLFQELSLLRSVAQKVQESVASDKPIIGRPAREARDILKAMDDESLQGLF
jgi:hypothetical protein